MPCVPVVKLWVSTTRLAPVVCCWPVFETGVAAFCAPAPEASRPARKCKDAGREQAARNRAGPPLRLSLLALRLLVTARFASPGQGSSMRRTFLPGNNLHQRRAETGEPGTICNGPIPDSLLRREIPRTGLKIPLPQDWGEMRKFPVLPPGQDFMGPGRKFPLKISVLRNFVRDAACNILRRFGFRLPVFGEVMAAKWLEVPAIRHALRSPNCPAPTSGRDAVGPVITDPDPSLRDCPRTRAPSGNSISSAWRPTSRSRAAMRTLHSDSSSASTASSSQAPRSCFSIQMRKRLRQTS